MRYKGGKFKIHKKLSEFINNDISNNNYTTYIEPFVGSCWVIKEINHENRIGSDKNEYIISLWQRLQEGWIPPENISNDEYNEIKNNKLDYPKELVAFVGFGCSFGGSFFGGYARSGNRNYSKNAKNSCLSKINKMKDVKFNYCDYRDYNPNNSIIYCDPPYSNTSHSYGINEKFDSVEFWNIMRRWTKNNTVYISEYDAPDDFEVVWFDYSKVTICRNKSKYNDKLEILFKYKG
jgi:DNA adenine methylase